MLKGSCPEYGALGWEFIPLKNYVIPFSSGLASNEKFFNNLVGVSFYVTSFFLMALQFFFDFFYTNYGVFQCTPLRFNLLGVLGVSWTWICFSMFGKFSDVIALNLIPVTLSSPFRISITQIFFLSLCPKIPRGFPHCFSPFLFCSWVNNFKCHIFPVTVPFVSMVDSAFQALC